MLQNWSEVALSSVAICLNALLYTVSKLLLLLDSKLQFANSCMKLNAFTKIPFKHSVPATLRITIHTHNHCKKYQGYNRYIEVQLQV